MESDDIQISMNDTEFVIGSHLEGIENLPPVAYQNKEFSGEPPYIEFVHSPNTVINDTLGSGFEHRLGIFLLTIVTPRNDFTEKTNDIAESIVKRFPFGLSLRRDGDNVLYDKVRRETVTINGPTFIGPSFADGSYWRQPVTVFYITE